MVAAFRAHTAHKTSEFLDLIEQTDVDRFDADWCGEPRTFIPRHLIPKMTAFGLPFSFISHNSFVRDKLAKAVARFFRFASE